MSWHLIFVWITLYSIILITCHTLQNIAVPTSDESAKYVLLYVIIQPIRIIVLIFGDDIFTILKIIQYF